MKIVRKITSVISAMITIVLFMFVVGMQFYPEETSRLVGYRFYTVLTNSMEPVIPTYSLVFSKMIDEDDILEPDTIVTFKANRFGEDILLTHYFRKTQIGDDGGLYYRTQGATADDYDNYETKRSDILGTYVGHVPYLGKIFLFLQSKFGLVLYGELFVIWMINMTIKTRWNEKAQEKKIRRKHLFTVHDLALQEEGECFILHGMLENNMKTAVRYVVASIRFYDESGVLCKEDRWYFVGKEALLPKQKQEFRYIITDTANIHDFKIDIIKYKH